MENKEYFKISFQDMAIAKEFFENKKHYNEWLCMVSEYYLGNICETNIKTVQKYFNSYKKTMNFVIDARETGKKGGLQRIENQSVKAHTLEGALNVPLNDPSTTLEATLEPNNKVIKDNSKRVNNNNKELIVKLSIEEREQIFYKNLTHYISEYDKDMVRGFFNYWSQKNSSATKMKFEDEKFFEISKRIATWKNNDKPKNVQFAKPIRESPLDFAKSSLLDYAKNNPEMIY